MLYLLFVESEITPPSQEGGTPGLVVKGGCLEFKSQRQILDGHFFNLYCLKRWNINEKEAVDGSFLKKHLLLFVFVSRSCFVCESVCFVSRFHSLSLLSWTTTGPNNKLTDFLSKLQRKAASSLLQVKLKYTPVANSRRVYPWISLVERGEGSNKPKWWWADLLTKSQSNRDSAWMKITKFGWLLGRNYSLHLP